MTRGRDGNRDVHLALAAGVVLLSAMKRCTACGEAKPLDQFHKQAGRSDGRTSQCKVCQRDRRRERRHEVPVDAERFWSRVNRDGPAPSHRPELGPCWVWTGGCDDDGYGTFSHAGFPVRAHRVAFLLDNGRWPTPCGLHRCDNRRCCRPDHVFEGTVGDNVRDMVSKGRLVPPPPPRPGRRDPFAKLTEDGVRAIRESHAAGISARELGETYGVSETTVREAVRRVTWAWVA